MSAFENTSMSDKRTPLVFALILGAVALLTAVYYAPIWWVSLTAPNYPVEAFPDGVRIHFHMNGVFNGCEKTEKTEIQEDEALDCVHEMDTINHYVGMYPIAAGGVVERAFAPFLIAMLAVMLVGFACTKTKVRLGLMGVGFAAVVAWMYFTYYTTEGLRFQSEGYVSALVTALDQDAGQEAGKELTPAQALIARMKAELGQETEQAPAAGAQAGAADKGDLLESLRITYEKDQERRPAQERVAWEGSGSQMLEWHYAKSLGRYFNNPDEIVPMVSAMGMVAHAFFGLIVIAMIVLLWGARSMRGPLYWLLVLVPMALPLFFIIDYSAWLWWYGHSLNDMGAFTVKAFMPTVFGDGKVAQFATHSYPYWGFGLMVLTSAVLVVAALIRRKQLKEL